MAGEIASPIWSLIHPGQPSCRPCDDSVMPTLSRRCSPKRSSTLGVLLVVVFATIGCGGEGSATPAEPKPEIDLSQADAGQAAVIDAWSSALREGDIEAAAELFALPSVAENGPQLTQIRNAADALAFNDSLPCGAQLTAAVTQGDFTTATFELTERPGGDCATGVGEEAQTAFVIEDGKIVEWRRVGAGGSPPADVI